MYNNVRVNGVDITKVTKTGHAEGEYLIDTAYGNLPRINKIDTYKPESVDAVKKAAENRGFASETVEILSVTPGQYGIGLVYHIKGKLKLNRDIVTKILEAEEKAKANLKLKKEVDVKIKEIERERQLLVKQSNQLKPENIIL